jgi:hypothetical protein
VALFPSMEKYLTTNNKLCYVKDHK